MPDYAGPAALITDPVQTAALLAAVLAAVFGLSRVRALDRVFAVVPPVIWAYFVPMLLTTLGVTQPYAAATATTPEYTNPAYALFGYLLLPLALFLLMLTHGPPRRLQHGPPRDSYDARRDARHRRRRAGRVPRHRAVYPGPDAWKGLAALSGCVDRRDGQHGRHPGVGRPARPRPDHRRGHGRGLRLDGDPALPRQVPDALRRAGSGRTRRPWTASTRRCARSTPSAGRSPSRRGALIIGAGIAAAVLSRVPLGGT